jgi:3-oxoacyl-[acyl-carrier protein] reductase
MNRTIVITGVGRIKGIGAEMAKTLAKKGYNIFFTYWSEYDKQVTNEFSKQDINNLIEEIKSYNVECYSLELDLSKVESIDKLFVEIDRCGNVYGLINNACHSVNDDYATISKESLDKHYDINLRATTLISCEFARRYEFLDGGRIINMISGQSLGPMYNELSYAITKGALETLTYTLAAALATKKITVNAINPGPTDTGWMSEALKEDLIKRFPFGRLGEPKDAANLASFLMSKEGEWISGQIIHSEGSFIRG